MLVDRNMDKFQNKPRLVISSLTKIPLQPQLGRFSCGSRLYPGRIGIWSVGFCGGRKTGEFGEKPSEQGREPTLNKLNPHMALVWNRTRATDSFNLVLVSLSLCNKLTNLSTASVHEALHIHANSACTLVKNCKLRLMVEQTSHLIQCNKNSINQL